MITVMKSQIPVIVIVVSLDVVMIKKQLDKMKPEQIVQVILKMMILYLLHMIHLHVVNLNMVVAIME